MAVTDQQKLDFLLKKIGYTKTKTGSVVGTGAISGTPKQPFAEAIPSPLIIANTALWNESGSIPATPPGSDTAQVKVYLAASSGLRMTADSTSSGQRAYIAYSTYGNASSTRLTNWIDTQFGSAYLIKVYKGDPNSGGVALSAAGSGANDGWFFDYSAGVLNFNDTSVPSGVTDTNIYIVGYRYIGRTGAPTSGISTFSNLDLTVERNLDVGKQGGISTFRHNARFSDNAELRLGDGDDVRFYWDGGHARLISSSAGQLDIRNDSLHLQSNSTANYAKFLGNKGVELYHVAGGSSKKFETTTTGINVIGDGVFSGNVSIGGTLTYEDVVNVDSVGIITAQAGIRVTGGVIEAQAGENKIPSLYSAMGNLPSAGSYHGMFAHVHATGRGYFAHAGNWLELVNKEINGVVGTGTETYNIGNLVSTSSTATSLNVSGVTTAVTLDVNGDLDVDGHTNLDNLSVGGATTITATNREIPFKVVAARGGGGIGTYLFTNSVGRFDFNFENTYNGNWNTGSTFHTRILWTAPNDASTTPEVCSIIPNTALAGAGGALWGLQFNVTDNVTGLKRAYEMKHNQHVFFLNGNQVGLNVNSTLGVGVTSYIYHGYTGGASDTNTRFGFASDHNIIFDTDGIERLRINNSSSTFAHNIIASADLDVDGHTNLDNLSVAGVSTFAGNINGKDITLTDTTPSITFYDSNANSDYRIIADNGVLSFADITNNANRINIFSNGNVKVLGNLDALDGIDVTGNTTVSGDLDVDGHTNLDNVSIAGVTTFAANTRFNSSITAGGGTGTNGQYLKTTGSGVAWATFPSLRTRDTQTASAGQTSFSFNYNVGLIDVFVNGVKLTDSEFTATNGTSVVLSVGSFVGDIIELVSYNTVSASGGAQGIGNLVEDLSPQLGGNLDLFNKSITGTGNVNITGIISATTFKGPSGVTATFIGDGSGLTGITASGSGVIIRDSGSLVGTAGTINFGNNLSVSAISGGSVTITASGGGGGTSGINTIGGVVNIVNDLDVDGHTNLDNVNVAGVTTFASIVNGTTFNATTFAGNGDFVDIDVDGHTNLDNVSVAGVTTFTGAISASDIRSNALTLKNAAGSASYAVFSNGGSALLKHNNTDRLETSASGVTVTGTVAATSYTGDGSQLTGITAGITTISGTVSVANDLDVDGHTNLDNVSIAGVVTATTLKGALQATSGTFSSSVSVTDSTESNSPTTGSVKLSGGLGVVKNIYTSGGVYVQGTAGLNVTHSADINGDLDVDGHTNLDNVNIAGVVTATTFVGDGSGLTGITASGSGVVIKHDGSTVGTAGTINFGTNLDVSAISGGAVTITASGGSGSGISTISGVVNIVNDLDVDGHTNLDNVSIAGVSTFTGDLTVDTNTFHVDSSNNRIGVGLITPARKLQIHQSDSTANYLHVTNDTTGSGVSDGALFGINSLEEAIVWNQENDNIIFGTNNTQRLTLNNSGHLVPAADATYNLGTNAIRFANIYGDYLHGELFNTVVATTQAAGNNTTKVATTAFVTTAIENANVGITTNLSGSFTASAGTPATINTLTGYSANDLVVEYTIYIKNGSDFQTQKLLAMRDGTTIHSTQFAVMFSSSLLVQCDATISSGNILLRATPETGVSGSTTYKIKREVM